MRFPRNSSSGTPWLSSARPREESGAVLSAAKTCSTPRKRCPRRELSSAALLSMDWVEVESGSESMGLLVGQRLSSRDGPRVSRSGGHEFHARAPEHNERPPADLGARFD